MGKQKGGHAVLRHADDADFRGSQRIPMLIRVSPRAVFLLEIGSLSQVAGKTRAGLSVCSVVLCLTSESPPGPG